VAELNTAFFLGQKTQQRFASLRYAFVIDNRDLRSYPLQGMYLLSIIRKDGLGFFHDRDALTLNTTFANYFKLKPKWNLEVIWKGLYQVIRKQQPYYNSRNLGFEPDYLRGYELYVVDGMDFTYLKTSLRRELFNQEIDLGKLSLIPQFRIMPLRVYVTLNSDVGYVNDPYYAEGNPLSNRWLFGAGLGLDIIAYHDKVWQIQYSFNHLLENGLFLHYKFSF
jgi:hypothetical protein